jgi:hypothetical protein
MDILSLLVDVLKIIEQINLGGHHLDWMAAWFEDD